MINSLVIYSGFVPISLLHWSVPFLAPIFWLKWSSDSWKQPSLFHCIYLGPNFSLKTRHIRQLPKFPLLFERVVLNNLFDKIEHLTTSTCFSKQWKSNSSSQLRQFALIIITKIFVPYVNSGKVFDKVPWTILPNFYEVALEKLFRLSVLYEASYQLFCLLVQIYWYCEWSSQGSSWTSFDFDFFKGPTSCFFPKRMSADDSNLLFNDLYFEIWLACLIRNWCGCYWISRNWTTLRSKVGVTLFSMTFQLTTSNIIKMLVCISHQTLNGRTLIIKVCAKHERPSSIWNLFHGLHTSSKVKYTLYSSTVLSILLYRSVI